jgi:hypothetical protein
MTTFTERVCDDLLQEHRPPLPQCFREDPFTELGAHHCNVAIIDGTVKRLQASINRIQKRLRGSQQLRAALELALRLGQPSQPRKGVSNATLVTEFPPDRQAFFVEYARARVVVPPRGDHSQIVKCEGDILPGAHLAEETQALLEERRRPLVVALFERQVSKIME